MLDLTRNTTNKLHLNTSYCNVHTPNKRSCLTDSYLTGCYTSLVVIPHEWSYQTGGHTSLVVIPHWWSYLTGGHTSLVVILHWWSYLTGGHTSLVVMPHGCHAHIFLEVIPHTSYLTIIVIILHNWRSCLTRGQTLWIVINHGWKYIFTYLLVQ